MTSPLRKLLHVAMAGVPLVGWLASFPWAVALSGVLLVACIAVEVLRRCWPWVNRTLWRLVPSIFREWERRGILGSSWFALGMLSTLLLCGRDAGGTAVLFLALGDPAAELLGRRWGRANGLKSWAGSAACLAACLAAAALGMALGGLSTIAAVAGALVATVAERWSPPPDDNLWMPLLSGLSMLLVQHLMSA